MRKIFKDGFVQYVDGAIDTINGVGKFCVMIVALLGIVLFAFDACTDLRLLTPDYSQGNAYIMYDNSCIKQRVYIDFSGGRFILYNEDFDMDVSKLQRLPGDIEKYIGTGKDGEQYTIIFPKNPYVIVQVISQDHEVVVSHKCLPI
jgi:hypothetical protein